jgi:hypothetical protein
MTDPEEPPTRATHVRDSREGVWEQHVRVQRAVNEDGLTIVGSGPAGKDESGRRERSPRLPSLF